MTHRCKSVGGSKYVNRFPIYLLPRPIAFLTRLTFLSHPRSTSLQNLWIESFGSERHIIANGRDFPSLLHLQKYFREKDSLSTLWLCNFSWVAQCRINESDSTKDWNSEIRFDFFLFFEKNAFCGDKRSANFSLLNVSLIAGDQITFCVKIRPARMGRPGDDMATSHPLRHEIRSLFSLIPKSFRWRNSLNLWIGQ